MADASTPHEYVLGHPRREHCKSGYAKKVRHVKRRSHGRTIKVAETVCVKLIPIVRPAPPKPTPTTPSPTPPVEVPPVTTPWYPPPALATSTVLNLGEPEKCGTETWDLGAALDQDCFYTMTATVTANGSAPASTAVNYVFEPGGESLFSEHATTPITVRVVYERVPYEAEGIKKAGDRECTLVIAADGVVLANGPSLTTFHVYARYAGTAGYERSQSTSHELHS